MSEETNTKVHPHSIKRYVQAIPEVIKYALFSSIILIILTSVFSRVEKAIIRSTGRAAVSTGDFAWIFTCWQGWLMIILVLVLVFLYTAIDINTKIYYSEDLFADRKDSLFVNLGKAAASLRLFLNGEGLLTVLYLMFALPLLNIGLSVGMTAGLYIPTFITSVINKNPLYLTLYIIVMVLFAFLLVFNIFVLHCLLLDNLSFREAFKEAHRLLKGHVMNFFGNSALFILKFGIAMALIILIVLVIPYAVVTVFVTDVQSSRFGLLFFTIIGYALINILEAFFVPFYIIKLTQLFHSYKEDKTLALPVRKKRHHPVMIVAVATLVLFAWFGGKFLAVVFDTYFGADITTGIIAHRLGGYEAAENTTDGLEVSISLGVQGAETDVQRTQDGYYVILHDDNFERLCGVDKKPSEMTLAEIKELTITDGSYTGKIATPEEVLDTAKGKDITLYIELKGETADEQMADDLIAMVEERDMRDQVVFISLKYELIAYIEENDTEYQTSYLTFASFGDTANLETDALAFEEESATVTNIEMVHEDGKKVQVWTPDDETEQEKYLTSEVDFIITDNVRQAQAVEARLNARSDMDRIIEAFFGF